MCHIGSSMQNYKQERLDIYLMNISLRQWFYLVFSKHINSFIYFRFLLYFFSFIKNLNELFY